MTNGLCNELSQIQVLLAYMCMQEFGFFPDFRDFQFEQKTAQFSFFLITYFCPKMVVFGYVGRRHCHCVSSHLYFTMTSAVVLLLRGHPFKNSQVSLQEEWPLMMSTVLSGTSVEEGLDSKGIPLARDP
jgi:hypothetical protein